jgi:hypothetical protein
MTDNPTFKAHINGDAPAPKTKKRKKAERQQMEVGGFAARTSL